jgi:hypothetical protein
MNPLGTASACVKSRLARSQNLCIDSRMNLLLTSVPPYVLHGTPADNVPGIVRDGLRFFQYESCFTTDLILACCVYAHPAYNPGYIEKGKDRLAAEKLVETGVIEAGSDRAGQLRNATRYWDSTNSGTVFVIGTENWLVGRSVTGVITVDIKRREIRGGITRWIGNYLSLYEPHTTESELGELARAFSGGTFYETDIWRRRRSLTVKPDFQATLAGTPGLRDALRNLEQQLCGSAPCGEGPEVAGIGDGGLGESLIEGTKVARLGRVARRLALSVARGRGFRVLKTDVKVPYDERSSVFYETDTISTRLVKLREYLEQLPQVSPPTVAAVRALDEVWNCPGSSSRDVAGCIAQLEALT